MRKVIKLTNGHGVIQCPSCNVTIPVSVPQEQQRITPKQNFMFPNDQTSYSNIVAEAEKQKLFAEVKRDVLKKPAGFNGYNNLQAFEQRVHICKKSAAIMDEQRRRGFV